MTKITPKAIFVGREDIAHALEGLRPDWEFANPVPTIDAFWEGLNDGSIDNNIQVVMILDTFFDPNGEETSFEKLISTMSPFCLFIIVQYRQGQDNAIRERVEAENYMSGNPDDALYFYVDPEHPDETLSKAIVEFSRRSKATDVIQILTGKDVVVAAPSAPDPSTSATSSLGPISSGSDRLGQIVAVTSSKGGSGKSTVSLTLATYLAHASEAAVQKKLEGRPLKVIVVDLDVRDGQLGFLTGYSKPTVITLRLNGISDEVFNQTVIHSDRLKLDLLLAPKRPRNSEDTPPDFYIELLQFLRERYDYIILDTSVNYLDPLLEKVAYPTADQIIFITDIVVNSVFSMTRWIREVTTPREKNGMGINKSKIGVVVNKALSDVGMDADKIHAGALGLPIISIIPSNPKLAAHAANLQSMEILLRHQEIRGSIRKIARAIVGKKYQLSDNF